MDVFSQRIQRADLGQRGAIVLAQFGHAQHEIVNQAEGVTRACVNQSVSYFFSQSSRIEQAEPERETFGPDATLRLKRAEPIGALHVDRFRSESMTLRVFHQRRRIVET